FVPLYMVVISVVYTHYTVGHVGDVSLYCPTANYASLVVPSIFAYWGGCCPSEEDFKVHSRFLSSVNLGSKDDSEALLRKFN
ncbi:23458_t:CDS:2, partial [Racocetra persica]